MNVPYKFNAETHLSSQVADFGLSKVLQNIDGSVADGAARQLLTTLRVGTVSNLPFFDSRRSLTLRSKCAAQIRYMAPEVLTGHGQYKGGPADIFSCGVMLFIMVHARPCCPPLPHALVAPLWHSRLSLWPALLGNH